LLVGTPIELLGDTVIVDRVAFQARQKNGEPGVLPARYWPSRRPAMTNARPR
jgi:hypothetical protein